MPLDGVKVDLVFQPVFAKVRALVADAVERKNRNALLLTGFDMDGKKSSSQFA